MIMASASGTPVSAIARLVAADEDTVRDGRCQMVCVKPKPSFRSITDSWLLTRRTLLG
jgi:hypothetical protein